MTWKSIDKKMGRAVKAAIAIFLILPSVWFPLTRSEAADFVREEERIPLGTVYLASTTASPGDDRFLDTTRGIDHSNVAVAGSIANVLSRLTGSESVLELPAGMYSFAKDCTFPAGVSLRMIEGAVLSPAANARLTISGPFSAGSYRVFGGEGTITFAGNATKQVLPEWWGAVGDAGKTDCTGALRRALATGKNLLLSAPVEQFYRITEPLLVAAPHQVVSGAQGHRSTIRQISKSKVALHITASDVHVKGIKIEGAQHSNYDALEMGILAEGSDAGSYIAGIHIENCDISGFGRHAVEFKYVEKSFVLRNYLHDSVRGGFVGYNVNTTDVSENRVENILPGDNIAKNAYGIVFAGSNTDPFGNKATNNYIKNIPQWMGLQCEPSSDTAFLNNMIIDCKYGINITGYKYQSISHVSNNCTVIGNTILNNTLGKAVGFAFGSGGTDPEHPNVGNLYQGNKSKGYGNNTPNEMGAAYFRFNKNMKFIDNTLSDNYRAGILLHRFNQDCDISGNTIDSVGAAGGGGGAIAAIHSALGHNDGTRIDRNTLIVDGVKAIYVATPDPLLRIESNFVKDRRK